MKVGLVIGIIVLAVVVATVGFVWYKKPMLITPAPTPMAQVVTTEASPIPVQDAISLVVTTPADGSKVTTSKVTVTGKTVPGADVSVNEANTVADAKGNFSVSVTLDEGDNYLVILAVDADGKTAQKQITVTSETFQ